jgi:hypothetical protein
LQDSALHSYGVYTALLGVADFAEFLFYVVAWMLVLGPLMMVWASSPPYNTVSISLPFAKNAN